MNIAVEATCWHNNRGYGRHARSLLKALVQLDRSNRYTFFLDSDAGLDGLPEGVEVRLVPAGSPASQAASADGRRSLGDLFQMSRALSSPGYDVLLYPSVYSYTPALTRARKIVFIHDVIAEKFPALTLPRRTARLAWGAKVALGRRQADALATVSGYSRRLLAEHFAIPAERVFVVGEASDPAFRRLPSAPFTPCLTSLGIPETGRLVAYVGGFGPHKNLEALVRAFAALAADADFSDVRLVLVGEYRKEVFYSQAQSVQAEIERLGIGERAIFTGYLPDEELVVLLNRAAVLALPSLMEGFGLPAVEAAACGCPVIATNQSPLPELLGEGGRWVDPARPEELADALRQVLESGALRQQMGQAGLEAAGKLTWEAAARQMLGVIEFVTSL